MTIIYDPFNENSELRNKVYDKLNKAQKKGLRVRSFLQLWNCTVLSEIPEDKLQEIDKLLDTIL